MNERLTFGYGTSGHEGEAPRREPISNPSTVATDEPLTAEPAPFVSRTDRRDWAFIGLLTFTALLFLRPQEQIPLLNPLHLAEISALLALAAMVMGRVGRGLPVTRYTPELGGVLLLGFTILATAPVSIWPGGAVATFTEIYIEIILMLVMMLHILTSMKRICCF